MALFDTAAIRKWLPLAEMTGHIEVESLVVDSRKTEKGSMYVALPGEKVDGHDFVGSALERGAGSALVSRSWVGNRDEVDPRWVVVENTLKALQGLAKGYLEQFSGLRKIALTGSNGKTTTKEMAGAIFSAWQEGIYTPGNYNSDIGLPLTAFMVREHHRWAIFEMGMNRVGEIAELVDIVHPEMALVTNVGTAHIGMLGSQEAIAREKRSIFSAFSDRETAIVWDEDPHGDFLLEGLRGPSKKYGLDSCRELLGVKDLGLNGQILQFRQGEIHLPLWGKHNLLNCLAAIAMAQHFDIPWSCWKEGLEGMEPVFGRGEYLQGSVDLVRDCYNANPDSMAKSLESFQEAPCKGRKILVLGDMGELGQESRVGHRMVWKLAMGSGADLVFTLGPEFKEAAGFKGDYSFLEYSELQKALLKEARPDDLIWLKGSRTLELERLTDPLMKI